MDGGNGWSLARYFLAAILLWLLVPAPVLAVEPTALLLKNPVAKTALEPSLLYACPGRRVDDLNAARRLDYQPLSGEIVSFGYQANPCWFRFRLHNISVEPLALMLEIDFPVLDHVRLFIPDDARSSVLVSGSADPYASHIVKNFLAFPLSLDARQARDYYLQIDTHTPLVVPISISSDAVFTESRIDRKWWQGIFFGIGIGLFFYNIFLWLTTREIFYAYYLAHLSFVLLFFSAVGGVSYPWWPDQPGWNSRSPHVFMLCLLCTGTLFAREFLATRIQGRSATQQEFEEVVM